MKDIILSFHNPVVAPMRAMILMIQLASSADHYASATVLSGAFAQQTENNQHATIEVGEPTNYYRSLWWKWVAPAHGRAVVETIGSDASSQQGSGTLAKLLNVYLPGSAAGLQGIASIGSAGGQTNAFPGLSFPVVAGTTYYIKVHCYHSNRYGNVTLTVSLNTSTDINHLNIQNQGLFANDFFANRARLTGPSASSVGYSLSASNEPGASEPENGYRTMWWTWTAPSNGRVVLSTTGSDAFGKGLAVFLGSSLPNLSWIALRGGQTLDYPQLSLPVTAGQTYQISVGSWNPNDGGSIVLSLSLVSRFVLRTQTFLRDSSVGETANGLTCR